MELAEILQKYAHIAGVDEVGRGPLVGAVVTAAVILDPNNPIEGLNDSKKLSDLKSQFKIEGTLDSEGLMRLFFTLKFFGEENNFISAIKPENLHQNPLLNYNLKLDDQDLKNLHILRSTDDVKNYEELQKNFFQKLCKKSQNYSVRKSDLKTQQTFDQKEPWLETIDETISNKDKSESDNIIKELIKVFYNFNGVF